MSFMKIEIEGVKKLEKRLKSLEPKVGKGIVRGALKDAAKPLLQEAKERVPVKSGDLKKSLRVRTMKRKKGRYGVEMATKDGWFKGDQYYGAFLEFGTKNMPAKPFMRPAYDNKKDEAASIIKSRIKSGLKRLGK